jgi:hypothetical protein
MMRRLWKRRDSLRDLDHNLGQRGRKKWGMEDG